MVGPFYLDGANCAGGPACRRRLPRRLGCRSRQLEYATVGGNVLDQKFHLVGEDLAVGEDQVLRLVGYVRSVDELQPGLLGKTVALDAVAGPARGDDVHPGIGAAARYRPDVISRKPQEAERPRAVRADVAVAAK